MIRPLLRWLWMLVGWVELLLLTAILYPLAFLPQKTFGRPWYRILFRLWSKAWNDALGVDLRLHQHNNQPLPRQYILIANHPSAFEDIGIPSLFPVLSLAKIEVRKWPVVGRISAAAGTLYVQRESRDSRQQASQSMLQALDAGHNIALYPEGGIKGKRLHDHFRYGAFDISLRSGIPILPVFLHYESQDDFHWSSQSLPRKILEFMATSNNRVNYHLHDAFFPEQFHDKESYCKHVYDRFLDWQHRYLD
ncbi:lysophospholipid acyltransferase family protein [Thiolapillus brandeum]|uniref:Lactoylglutathione lyase n=1 Tax=Thiolapillus brandeum TaxID=1076588 RepID=A0A7U6JIF9_9GAMM|nr:lysophospholipid acyltransferase family protein [Thiolapillus brandeum]BAO44753.1 lactoylglutathione lyase [Thiolapillus brandeum]